MSESVLKLALLSHSAHPAPPGLALSVACLPAADPQTMLRLRYGVAGAVAAVRWPAPLAADAGARRDGLWQHTCFEAFVAAGAGEGAVGGYVEFNFAPSGAWAAYRFDGYRAGMRAEPLEAPPRIVARRAPDAFELEVAVPWPAPGGPASPGRASRLRLGLTAVVEAGEGSLSYWALRHPPGRPDFHNAAGFQLELEVPG